MLCITDLFVRGIRLRPVVFPHKGPVICTTEGVTIVIVLFVYGYLRWP